MVFAYDDEFMNIKIYEDIPDVREEKPKEIIEIPDIMEAWEFYKGIVRCKKCKWAKANGTYQWCGRLDSTARITADDFCSYGTRKD